MSLDFPPPSIILIWSAAKITSLLILKYICEYKKVHLQWGDLALRRDLEIGCLKRHVSNTYEMQAGAHISREVACLLYFISFK